MSILKLGFSSEKQRRFMHAKFPDLAKKMEASTKKEEAGKGHARGAEGAAGESESREEKASKAKRLLEKKAEIEYRGKTFSGYNQPRKSDRPDKKMMVLAKKGDEVRLIHFGQKGYRHNYSEAAKKSYLARSGGIRNKSGELTANDKFSANYWARRVLWPKGAAKNS